MRKILIMTGLVMCFYSTDLFSQSQPLQAKKKTTFFRSYNNLVLLTGQQTVSGGIQSVNGIEWNSFFAGAGIGFDFYRAGTTPLFLDLRKSFGKGKNQVFVYGDIGYNFTWPGNGIYYYGSNEKPDLKGGLYTDIGLGYQKGIGRNDALVLSAGYSYKTFTEYITAFPLCLIGYPCEPYQSEFLYKLNRLSFKIGWRF